MAEQAPSGKHRLFALVKSHFKKDTVVLASAPTDIWLRLNLSTPLTVVGVYRQWSNTESSDLAAFHNRCATLLDGNRTIITGDFNLDLARKSDSTYSRHTMASNHFAMMEALGLHYEGPFIPTYRSHGSYKSGNGEYTNRTSILDHVYTTSGGGVSVSVISSGVTDHLPLRIDLSISSHCSRRLKWVPRRPLSKLSSSSLCLALEQSLEEANTDLYNCGDVEVVHKTIVMAIINALDKVAPYKLVPANKPDRPPLFLAPDTLHAMRLRDRAAACRSPHYRSLRNKACRLLRRDRLKSSLNLINNSKNNPRKLWSLAKSFMRADTNENLPSSLISDDGEELTSENELTDSLNSFFLAKISRIRDSLPVSRHTSLDLHDNFEDSDKFSFKYPSAGKVMAVISSLKNTGATGVDDIPICVLKLGAPVLASPIAHLLRLSFTSARVPSGFKSAIVRPTYKGKGKPTNDPSSYRPIALLTAMSKVLERCVFETLVEFLEPKLPSGQYGFRPGRSTTAAIADAHGRWSSVRAAGQVLGVVGFDLTAAFDPLDASVLCSKLANLGICGHANKWFQDYLINRSQCVALGGSKSSFMPVKFGVPQGSLLGPVLFIAIVSDLPAKAELTSLSRGYVAYADDICVWSSGNSVVDVKKDLELIATSVCQFTADNYLSLSAEKTQIMWSGLPAGDCGPDVDIGGVLVKPTSSIELLGVKFDKNLSSTPFLSAQLKATVPILATIRRLSCFLPPAHLAKVASAFLIGKLAYAAPATLAPRLSGDEPVTAITNKVQICINNAARTILGSSRGDKLRTEVLLARTGLPSINRLLVKGIAVECWRAINESTPLGAVITGGHMASRLTRMGASNKLPPPFKFPKDSMAWHAVRLWNMHDELRSAPSLSCARKVAAKIASACPL